MIADLGSQYSALAFPTHRESSAINDTFSATIQYMKTHTVHETPSNPHWRTRASLALAGGMLAITLPALFLAQPAAAQNTVDQTAVTQLLRSVIALQTQVMESGNRELLSQSQALLTQVRELMTAIETGGPLPAPATDDGAAETDSTTETEPGSSTDGTAADDSTTSDAGGAGESIAPGTSTTATRVNGVTVCPELSVTERELRTYIDGAYSLERQNLINSYEPDIPAGVECLGEAILRQCETAVAHHEDGYTFYVTSGESSYDDPVFGRERCYIGLSERDRPEEATTCNLLSIANADRGRDGQIGSISTGLVSTTELNWFLKVTLPEFIADHALPLGDQRTYFGMGRDRDSGTYYYGTDPVARLATQMECTRRAIDLEPEESL